MPQDWAPYTSVQDAATVYLRDPELALEQLRSVIEFPGIAAFIMSRGDDEFADDRRKLKYTQLVTRARRTSATESDLYCESFRYTKSVDNGGLAQMERLLQFGRVLSRSM